MNVIYFSIVCQDVSSRAKESWKEEKEGRSEEGEGGEGGRRREGRDKVGEAGAGLCVKRWHIKSPRPSKGYEEIKVHGPNEH